MLNVPVLLVAGRKHIYACGLTYVLTLACLTWHHKPSLWGLGPQSCYHEKDNYFVSPWLWGRAIPAWEQEHARVFPVYTQANTPTLKTHFKCCPPFLHFPTVIVAASKCMSDTLELCSIQCVSYNSLAHMHIVLWLWIVPCPPKWIDTLYLCPSAHPFETAGWNATNMH